MEISDIRVRWVEILDHLERADRIAWLTFFDARLDSLVDSTLYLDFSDSRKFASGHEFSQSRPNHRAALERAIHEVLLVDIQIVEK